jgi:hypothetical protein
MVVAHFGNNEILPAGLKYIDRKMPDYTTSVLPVIQFLRDQLNRNNTGAKPTVPAVDKNAPDLSIQLEVQNNASLSASALNRFYLQLDKLYTQMYKRAIANDYVKGDGGYELVKAFREELRAEGVTNEELESVLAVTAVRTVGSGSAANRLMSYQRLNSVAGAFDAEGRKNLVYDIVVEEVGHEHASRYIEPVLPEQERKPIDTKVAELETNGFFRKETCEVLPNEDHFVHAIKHTPRLLQMMDQIEQAGENIEPDALIEAHGILTAALPHCGEHANFMADDKARKAEAKEFIKILSQLSAARDRLQNQITRLQKAAQEQQQAEMERQQQQQAAYVAELEKKAAEGGPDNSKAQAMLMQAQVKAAIMEQEWKQKMAHKEAEFNLDKAIKDAKAANELLNGAKASVGEEQ